MIRAKTRRAPQEAPRSVSTGGRKGENYLKWAPLFGQVRLEIDALVQMVFHLPGPCCSKGHLCSKGFQRYFGLGWLVVRPVGPFALALARIEGGGGETSFAKHQTRLDTADQNLSGGAGVSLFRVC